MSLSLVIGTSLGVEDLPETGAPFSPQDCDI